jgi:hypothetical protein
VHLVKLLFRAQGSTAWASAHHLTLHILPIPTIRTNTNRRALTSRHHNCFSKWHLARERPRDIMSCRRIRLACMVWSLCQHSCTTIIVHYWTLILATPLTSGGRVWCHTLLVTAESIIIELSSLVALLHKQLLLSNRASLTLFAISYGITESINSGIPASIGALGVE